jgi:hypothetical protein
MNLKDGTMNTDIIKAKRNSMKDIRKISKSLNMYALATVICLALAIGLLIQKEPLAGFGWLVAAIISCLSAYREITLKR